MQTLRIAANPLFMRAAGLFDGAGEMNRTPDLLITNELLYRLSYTGCILAKLYRWDQCASLCAL